uniref:Uncharacterized protein n=1 Tax=Ananas comosus var. bracteatus TaxID=296719 RepID=A0A6V7Q113_ANACO|nr:unnamed protein product [Ananas comosus var. bracteatus]
MGLIRGKYYALEVAQCRGAFRDFTQCSAHSPFNTCGGELTGGDQTHTAAAVTLPRGVVMWALKVNDEPTCFGPKRAQTRPGPSLDPYLFIYLLGIEIFYL